MAHLLAGRACRHFDLFWLTGVGFGVMASRITVPACVADVYSIYLIVE